MGFSSQTQEGSQNTSGGFRQSNSLLPSSSLCCSPAAGGGLPISCSSDAHKALMATLVNVDWERVDDGHLALCPICERTFSGKRAQRKSNLKRHIATHFGLKPFECPKCCSRFSRKSDLKERIHKDPNFDDPPSSSSPTASSSSGPSTSLNARFGITFEATDDGTNCRCPICWRVFTGPRYRRKYNFKVHMGIHYGLKPFECSLCNRKFSRKSSVKSHLSGGYCTRQREATLHSDSSSTTKE